MHIRKKTDLSIAKHILIMKDIYYIIITSTILIGLLLLGCTPDSNKNLRQNNGTSSWQTKPSRDTTIVYNITSNNNITTTINIEENTINMKVIENNTINNDIKIVQDNINIIVKE